MIGGDFNMISSSKDKNNRNIDYKWVDKFNTWVEMWALLEIGFAGRAYTWSNNQEDQVMCKLDRVFCTTNFDDVFPLSSARALAKIGSDHTPIIWESGDSHRPRKGGFKFEKWWLVNPEFKELVGKAWSLETNSVSTLDKWHAKIRKFRSLAKGWSANQEAAIRKQKRKRMGEYDLIDIKSETQILSVEEKARLDFILRALNSFWIMEKTKAK
jgi:hypothetical protein